MPIEIDDDPRSIRELLAQDRDLTFAGVELLAQSLSPDEAEGWELAFLHSAATLDDPALRLRAMEVYAHLKVAQAAHCEPFPGYVGPAGPLPLDGVSRR
jgi:hypothetical protein